MSLCQATPERGDAGKRRDSMHKISMGRTAVRLGAVALMVGGIGVVGASTSYAGGHGTITKEPWGTTAGGQAVDRYTLTNNGIRVKILTYGGTLQTIDM